LTKAAELAQVQVVTPLLEAILLLAPEALGAFQAALEEVLGPTLILRICSGVLLGQAEELVVGVEVLSNRKRFLLGIVLRCKQRFRLWRLPRERAKR
jgi:hypothetical protein